MNKLTCFRYSISDESPTSTETTATRKSAFVSPQVVCRDQVIELVHLPADSNGVSTSASGARSSPQDSAFRLYRFQRLSGLKSTPAANPDRHRPGKPG